MVSSFSEKSNKLGIMDPNSGAGTIRAGQRAPHLGCAMSCLVHRNPHHSLLSPGASAAWPLNMLLGGAVVFLTEKVLLYPCVSFRVGSGGREVTQEGCESFLPPSKILSRCLPDPLVPLGLFPTLGI